MRRTVLWRQQRQLAVAAGCWAWESRVVSSRLMGRCLTCVCALSTMARIRTSGKQARCCFCCAASAELCFCCAASAVLLLLSYDGEM